MCYNRIIEDNCRKLIGIDQRSFVHEIAPSWYSDIGTMQHMFRCAQARFVFVVNSRTPLLFLIVLGTFGFDSAVNKAPTLFDLG